MNARTLLAPSALIVVALSGCATPPATDPGATQPAFVPIAASLPSGPVTGEGTVITRDGESRLCFSVLESFPPQCGFGVPLTDWPDDPGYSETAGDVTWGAYVVTGTWDGTRLTATDHTTLALHDPIAPPPRGPGEADPDTVSKAAQNLERRMDDLGIVTLAETNGWVDVSVVWDDGTLQDALDAEFSPGVVAVHSLLRTGTA